MIPQLYESFLPVRRLFCKIQVVSYLKINFLLLPAFLCFFLRVDRYILCIESPIYVHMDQSNNTFAKKNIILTFRKKLFVTSISDRIPSQNISSNSGHPRMSAPCLEKREGQNTYYYTNQEADQERALPTQIMISPLPRAKICAQRWRNLA